MSMQTSVSYGFGIDGYDLAKIPDENLANFAKKHLPSTYWKKDIQTMSTDDILEEIETFEDKTSTTEGPYAIISSTITEETGIEFAYENTEYGKAIMFYAGLPWDFKDTEKDFTPEKLQTIVQPYLNELDIPNVMLDNVSVEHFG